MTKDIIERNRGLYIKEFKATGRSGIGHIINYLDSHHFFEARCNGHDREPGGTANHSLWVLKFARETREAILKKYPEKDIPEDELIFTCLLHDVCDCNPKPHEHGRRSRGIMEKLIKGFSFSNDVLDAVNSHMHSCLYGNKHKSSQKSRSKRELLHYMIVNSDHRAIEYAGGIPFGTGTFGYFRCQIVLLPRRACSHVIRQSRPIGITQQVNYEYDDPDSAIDDMRGNTGHTIRVQHTSFFKKVVI